MKEAKSTKTQCYEALKRAILTLELGPGMDLDEVLLCGQYGLSRTPLREVFRQLAGEGYVSLQNNRGARVAEMTHKTLRDFFLTAPMIYGAVLRLAARNANALQISALKDAQSEFVRALDAGTVVEKTLANNLFHEITGEMADNIFLRPSFNRLLIDHARIGMTFYEPRDERMKSSVAVASSQHYAIIECIEGRNEDGAAALAEEHWQLSRDQIESFVMPNALNFELGVAANTNSS